MTLSKIPEDIFGLLYFSTLTILIVLFVILTVMIRKEKKNERAGLSSYDLHKD